MKKTMILAAFAALLSLASISCQKESLNEAVVKEDPSAESVSESPVFTATIEDGSKTTLNATSGKVSWEETDEITVTDKEQKSAVFSIESINATTGSATFIYKSGDNLGDGPYTATYGTAPATEQIYTPTPGQLYMTAQSETTSLTFTVQCGLMEINLHERILNGIRKIAVTGTPADGSETTYTLTCSPSILVSGTKSFYIAVPAGIYNKIVIIETQNRACTLTAPSGIKVEANHIKPLTFYGSKLKFYPVDALKGVFSVGPDRDEKVHFSKGNLYCSRTSPESNDWTWHFYSNQYDCNSLNLEGESGFRQANDTDTEIDLFTWGYNAINSVKPTDESNHVSIISGELPGEEDWSYWWNYWSRTSLYRTLTSAEWQYLFSCGSYTNEIRKDKYKYGVTVCGKINCVVLLPDNWKWEGIVGTNWQTNENDVIEYSEETSIKWSTMQEAGAVCLPAAGYRIGSDVCDVDYNGNYWSSSAYDKDWADYVLFDGSGVNPDKQFYRSFGASVRLVAEAEPER